MEEFSPKILLSMEKEMLGLYLSAHPLESYREAIRRASSVTTEDFRRKPAAY